MGSVVLRHEKLALTGVTGQLLVVHHAEPDTPSAAAFAELARTVLDVRPGLGRDSRVPSDRRQAGSLG
jgi:hypothetical protein